MVIEMNLSGSKTGDQDESLRFKERGMYGLAAVCSPFLYSSSFRDSIGKGGDA
jgi:hypothetical protein